MSSIKSAQLNGTINQYEIPATMRKDGSWRKARKVKPGFVPQEEVPKYTPLAKRVASAQSSAYPPGWHPTEPAVSKNKVENKPKPPAAEKAKIKEKKENVVKVTATVVDELSEKLQDATVSSVDPTIELSKKLKRLRKRLRESELIDEKIKAGEVAAVNPSQLEKSTRRKEFEDEIEQLEAERLKLRQLKPNKNP